MGGIILKLGGRTQACGGRGGGSATPSLPPPHLYTSLLILCILSVSGPESSDCVETATTITVTISVRSVVVLFVVCIFFFFALMLVY